MTGFWKRLFGGKGITIPDADKLLEGEARKVDIGDVLADGRQVLLCRTGGKVYALDAECPHAGGRLIPGPLAEGKYAFCPLHNYTFDPKSGAVVEGACSAAKTYRVKEADGKLELFM